MGRTGSVLTPGGPVAPPGAASGVRGAPRPTSAPIAPPYRTPSRAWWAGESELWRSRRALVLVCMAGPVLETALVFAVLPTSSPSLAPQLSALAPFGVFHDLRWMSVYANSWPTLAALFVGIFVARGALTALSVRLAWPAGTAPPAMRGLVARGVGATVLAAVCLVPSTALLYGLALVPVSWLFLAAVPLALGIAIVVHPVAVSGDWWRRSIPLRAVGWVAVSFVVLTAAAAVIAVVPGWAVFMVVVGAGIFNARAWVGMVSAVVDPKRPRRIVPAVPVALAVIAAVVALGSITGFTHAGAKASARPAAGAYRVPASGQRAVLVVSGYGSHWDGRSTHPVPGAFYEAQFSYRGLASSGRPLPYVSAETVRPLPVLDATLAAQVAALHRATGRDVDIVAESEGALVAKTYLVSYPGAPVSAVVMASPLLEPGRVTYPLGGATTGFGLPSRDALQVLGGAYQSVAPINLSPQSPFLRSVDRLAPLLRGVMACPAPGVRQFAVLPLADATSAPPRPALPFPSVVVAAFHGGLIGSSSTDPLVAAVFDGREPAGNTLWRGLYGVVAAGSSAWQVPGLVLPGSPGVSSSTAAVASHCAALAAALRS